MKTEGVDVRWSSGSGKAGKLFVYIRPEKECGNRSRRIGGFYGAEFGARIDKLIKKWFIPIKYYKVNNDRVIGSNSEKNALTEYWRVCEREDIGKIFPVTEIINHINKFD